MNKEIEAKDYLSEYIEILKKKIEEQKTEIHNLKQEIALNKLQIKSIKNLEQDDSNIPIITTIDNAYLPFTIQCMHEYNMLSPTKCIICGYSYATPFYTTVSFVADGTNGPVGEINKIKIKAEDIETFNIG